VIEFIIVFFPWILSATTIWMLIKAGDKNKVAWIIGGCNQIFWTVWIVVSGTWGLFPLTVAMVIVSVRNYSKWKKGEII